ncbi:hypothetical protein HOD20_07930 [archaeon]|jgi:hypothetical protein|nr:hypothetical protein [archaeon]MBT4648034.1 hypothetical protein [archaeon]MBT6822712.1 hypothetical protein [archaeon]MBT7392455.1 hypothetical protein [archaeon]
MKNKYNILILMVFAIFLVLVTTSCNLPSGAPTETELVASPEDLGYELVTPDANAPPSPTEFPPSYVYQIFQDPYHAELIYSNGGDRISKCNIDIKPLLREGITSYIFEKESTSQLSQITGDPIGVPTLAKKVLYASNDILGEITYRDHEMTQNSYSFTFSNFNDVKCDGMKFELISNSLRAVPCETGLVNEYINNLCTTTRIKDPFFQSNFEKEIKFEHFNSENGATTICEFDPTTILKEEYSDYVLTYDVTEEISPVLRNYVISLYTNDNRVADIIYSSSNPDKLEILLGNKPEGEGSYFNCIPINEGPFTCTPGTPIACEQVGILGGGMA